MSKSKKQEDSYKEYLANPGLTIKVILTFTQAHEEQFAEWLNERQKQNGERRISRKIIHATLRLLHDHVNVVMARQAENALYDAILRHLPGADESNLIISTDGIKTPEVNGDRTDPMRQGYL